MAWTAPMTAVSNTQFTAAQFNTHVRDNLLETAPALASLANQYPVATGTNAIAMRRINSASALPTQTTTSTSYTLASGPTVAVTTGTTALVFLYAIITIDTNSASAFFSCDVSGATTVAANDNRALTVGRYTTQFLIGASQVTYVTGLTAGSNTFSGHIRVTAGTGTYDNRRIVIMPF